MSTLAKMVMAKDTGQRQAIIDHISPVYKKLFDMKEHIINDPITMGKIYRVEVTFGSQVVISMLDMESNKDVLDEAVRRTKRSIVEAVFGEFREDIIELYRALYNRDFNTSLKVLEDLELKMYHVD